MIAKGAGGVADAVFQRIADQAAPSGIRHVQPHVEPLLLNMPIDIEVTGAGLDQREVALVIDSNDAIHAPQIDNHAA